MSHHVAMQLTEGGGPPPEFELRRVAECFDLSPDKRTWIASRKPGSGFCLKEGDSMLLAFARCSGRVLVLEGRVLQRRSELPAVSLVEEMYADWKTEMHAYWQLTDVVLHQVDALQELPWKTTNGLSLEQAFRGSLTFAYIRSTEQPSDSRRSARQSDMPASAPRTLALPTLPLHGVDFSGSAERDGGNPKIWIASWDPGEMTIRLVRGTDGKGLGRAGLALRILDGAGWWVLDFPFGPAAQTAAVVGWTSWVDYLEWAASRDDPAVLRDALRETVRAAGVPWSIRRTVDEHHGTTWFPFFQYIFRQTITGARDVLRPLAATGQGRVRILPFDKRAEGEGGTTSTVLEGFPGHTLRSLGLSTTGYKQATDASARRRREIVDALIARGLPIDHEVARLACNDGEGDGVDALVLLWAAYQTHQARGLEPPEGGPWHIEGWFWC